MITLKSVYLVNFDLQLLFDIDWIILYFVVVGLVQIS